MLHIIDDNEDLIEVMHDLLESEGFQSKLFESGEHYIEYLNSSEYEEPVAVITDVRMPGIHGYDLALYIREQHPFHRIVVNTGFSDDEQNQEAASQLCYSLDKSESPIELLRVAEALSRCAKNKGKTQFNKHCEFGLQHDCPFHS